MLNLTTGQTFWTILWMLPHLLRESRSASRLAICHRWNDLVPSFITSQIRSVPNTNHLPILTGNVSSDILPTHTTTMLEAAGWDPRKIHGPLSTMSSKFMVWKVFEWPMPQSCRKSSPATRMHRVLWSVKKQPTWFSLKNMWHTGNNW